MLFLSPIYPDNHFLSYCQIPRRDRCADVEVRVCNLATSPERAVAAHQ